MNNENSFSNFQLSRLSELLSLTKEIHDSGTVESKFRAMKHLEDFKNDSIAEKISGGDIILGITPKEEILVPEGTPVTILSRFLNMGFVTMAMVRAGKTFLLMWILFQLSKLGINWTVFERKKSFRQIVELTDAVIVSPEELNHNLLRPPKGVPFKAHLMKLCNIFAGTQILTNVSEHLLYEIIFGNQLEYEKANPGKYLDIFHVKMIILAIIEKATHKWQRSIYQFVGLDDRWNGICTYLGNVYSNGGGVESYDLLSKNKVIIDCSELSNSMIAFFFFEILSIFTLSRLSSGSNEKNTSLHIVVADEFEDIIAQVNVLGYSLLIDHWRRDRELNLGKMIVNHTADFHQKYDSQIITSTITTNNHYHVIGKMGNKDELVKIGKRLGFEARHYDWLLGDGERHFVLATPIHPPICFVASEANFPEFVDMAKQEEHKKKLLSLYPSEPIPVSRRNLAMSQVFRKDGTNKTMEDVRTQAKENLRTEALKFCSFHAASPFAPYSELRKGFKSIEISHKAKNFCLESDWLQEALISEGRGRPSLYFHLTEKGRNVILDEGLIKKSTLGHQIKHHTWPAMCTTAIEKRLKEGGLKVQLDSGDGIDLIVKDTNDIVLCGIEFNYKTPVSYELKLIQKEIDKGLPKVSIVVLDFKEIEGKKNSFKMVKPVGKMKAFAEEIKNNFADIENKISIIIWEESLKWNPLQ